MYSVEHSKTSEGAPSQNAGPNKPAAGDLGAARHIAQVATEKRFEQNRGDIEDWDSSRDGSHPNSPLNSVTGKRKSSECDRQPESPGDDLHDHTSWRREKHFRADPMDMDSPASYPKDVMVSEDAAQAYARSAHGVYQEPPVHTASISTPVLTHESERHAYDHPSFRPSFFPGTANVQEHSPAHGTTSTGGHSHGQSHGHFSFNPHPSQAQSNSGSPYQTHTPPRQPHHFSPEMSTPPRYGPPPVQPDSYGRRRWACDYCSVATFSSYEEACAHEEACARRNQDQFAGRSHATQPHVLPYENAHHGGSGLGALYHATQEVNGPPMPHRKPMWGTHRGPTMPHLPPPHPHHGHLGHVAPRAYHSPQGRFHHPYAGFDGREGPMAGRNMDPFQKDQKRMLLAMPTDSDSLSDRQCFVRSEMVEIFAATDKDVAARHSKGAQKLVLGQVGIRCVHCSHLRPRDRAERAVCYPSSISRIYQTVADMQRFHFEQCREIPNEIRKIYKSLKTTRPRGVGSPQTYWMQSAKMLDLVDTDAGIRFGGDVKKESKPKTNETGVPTPATS